MLLAPLALVNLRGRFALALKNLRKRPKKIAQKTAQRQQQSSAAVAIFREAHSSLRPKVPFSKFYTMSTTSPATDRVRSSDKLCGKIRNRERSVHAYDGCLPAYSRSVLGFSHVHLKIVVSLFSSSQKSIMVPAHWKTLIIDKKLQKKERIQEEERQKALMGRFPR